VVASSRSRRSSRRRRSRGRWGGERKFAGLLVVLGTVVLTGLVVWWGVFPPGAEDEGVGRASPEELESWQKLRDERIKAFEETVTAEEGGSGEPALLEEAIRWQERIVRAEPGANGEERRRLEEWRDRRERISAVHWWEEARALQEEGEALESEDAGAARDRYQTALQLYTRVAGAGVETSREARQRAILLRGTLLALEVGPLREKSRQREEQAGAALAAGRWEEARQFMVEAAVLQGEINRKAPGSRYASPARAADLRKRAAGIGARREAEGIAGRIREALAFLREGRLSEAQTAVAEALEGQRDLREEYPGNLWVDPAREQALRALEANLAAREAYRTLREEEQALRVALQAGNFAVARTTLEALSAGLESFGIRYPSATLPVGPLRERVAYLAGHADTVPEIATSVRANLASVPGSRVLWLRTEVPQRLYEAVMGENPSRSVAVDQPVEAVTPREVEGFLRRLGWILGTPVRLPTHEGVEALSAIEEGEVSPERTLARGSRRRPSVVDAGEPGPHGLYHLRGNVAEIVTDGQGDFLAYGDSFARGEGETIRAGPGESLTAVSRSRTTGFRFVVEEGEDGPLLPEEREILLAGAEAVLAQFAGSAAR